MQIGQYYNRLINCGNSPSHAIATIMRELLHKQYNSYLASLANDVTDPRNGRRDERLSNIQSNLEQISGLDTMRQQVHSV